MIEPPSWEADSLLYLLCWCIYATFLPALSSALIKLRISPIDFSENQRSCINWKQARHDAVHIPHANFNLGAGPPQSPTTFASCVLQLLYNTHYFLYYHFHFLKYWVLQAHPLDSSPTTATICGHCFAILVIIKLSFSNLFWAIKLSLS